MPENARGPHPEQGFYESRCRIPRFRSRRFHRPPIRNFRVPTPIPGLRRDALLARDMPIHVLVADDSEAVRWVIRTVLEGQPEIRIIGEAAGFSEALHLLSTRKPDLVLIDVQMLERSFFTPETIEAAFNGHPAQMLCMSFGNDKNARATARSFGSEALVNKSKLAEELGARILRYARKSGARRQMG